jgi:hypothetical protein
MKDKNILDLMRLIIQTVISSAVQPNQQEHIPANSIANEAFQKRSRRL